MSMPLKKRPFRGPRSLTAKVNTLSKAVNANKNEKQYFLKSANITIPASGAGINVTNLSCISDQFTDSDFPFTVSGDKWNLHSLRLQGLSDRTIVYFPKKAGTRFAPANFNEIPDPKQFTILMDSTQPRGTFGVFGVSNVSQWSNYRSARDLRLARGVLINRSGAGAGSTVERGDLVICHINQAVSGSSTTTKSVSYRLTFTDK